MFLIFAIYSTATYLLLVKNTDLNKKAFFVFVAISNFIIYPLMGLLESLFWGYAFFDISIVEHFKTFMRLTITYLVFTGILSFFVKKSTETNKGPVVFEESTKEIIVKLSMIAVFL